VSEEVIIGDCRLILGDCREVLPLLPACDLILTDPPYGIGEAAKNNKSRGVLAQAKDYGKDTWDNEPPPAWVIELMRAKGRWQVLFGGNYYALPPATCWLVWDKDNGENDFADCELAWTNLPKAVRRLRWKWHGMLQQDMSNKEVREHPTQKPLKLIQWCLKWSKTTGLILDPFMGSGTTLVAAKNLGRRAIGIEIEPKYCEIAVQRLAQKVMDFGEAA